MYFGMISGYHLFCINEAGAQWNEENERRDAAAKRWKFWSSYGGLRCAVFASEGWAESSRCNHKRSKIGQGLVFANGFSSKRVTQAGVCAKLSWASYIWTSFQLSVRHNRLLRMLQVSKLSHLKILNLSHNCVVTMEGLRELKLLTWLSLASNSIKGIECLSHNVRLEHLDLSDNAIPAVADIAHLKNLKVRYLLSKLGVWRRKLICFHALTNDRCKFSIWGI